VLKLLWKRHRKEAGSGRRLPAVTESGEAALAGGGEGLAGIAGAARGWWLLLLLVPPLLYYMYKCKMCCIVAELIRTVRCSGGRTKKRRRMLAKDRGSRWMLVFCVWMIFL